MTITVEQKLVEGRGISTSEHTRPKWDYIPQYQIAPSTAMSGTATLVSAESDSSTVELGRDVHMWLSINKLQDVKVFLDNDGIWQCDSKDVQAACSDRFHMLEDIATRLKQPLSQRKKFQLEDDLDALSYRDPNLYVGFMLWALNSGMLTFQQARELDLYLHLNCPDRKHKKLKNDVKKVYGISCDDDRYSWNSEYAAKVEDSKNIGAYLGVMLLAGKDLLNDLMRHHDSTRWSGHRECKLTKLEMNESTLGGAQGSPSIPLFDKAHWRTLWSIFDYLLSKKKLQAPSHVLTSFILFCYEDMQHHFFSRELLPDVVVVLDKLVTNYDIPLQRIPKGVLRRCCGESETLQRCRNACASRSTKPSKYAWNYSTEEGSLYLYKHGNILTPLSIRGIARYSAAASNCSSNDNAALPIHPSELIKISTDGSRLRETLINGYEEALRAARSSHSKYRPFGIIERYRQRRILRKALITEQVEHEVRSERNETPDFLRRRIENSLDASTVRSNSATTNIFQQSVSSFNDYEVEHVQERHSNLVEMPKPIDC